MKFDVIIARSDIAEDYIIHDVKQMSMTRSRTIISSDDANEIILSGLIDSIHVIRDYECEVSCNGK